MSELARLLLFVAIAGSAVTFLGSLAIWYGDEDRRIRRALRNVLKGEPEGVVVARGRGRGAGFSFATNLMAVAWDRGGWCLVYRLDELMGAELLIDGQVMGRVFRGEGRRAIDHVSPQAETVTLRLVFDDPRHPDFALELWVPGDELRRESRSPAELVQEANRWLARCEAIVRRPLPPRPAPAAQPAAAPVAPRPAAAAPAPLSKPFDDEMDDDATDDDDVRPPPPLPDTPPPLARRSSFDDVPLAAAQPISRPTAPPPATAAPQPPAREAELDMFGDPPWDDEDIAPTPPPEPEPSYKPVSKARRETASDQDELPFDLDD
ncbi:hypothetical protein [Caulobacter sp. RL271]|jgi:hypothetical protein|uniref:Uncharacterized protein n=1 Tax=Caulobacter segnis TaxID=88688 RepID=A0ABY4ZYX0_9CAUL|nr:hypothetical protein [Caulobacter segnis]USQ97766.1 hypothetical protein MZV50_09610 [Caulobacter segnis]